MINMTEEWKLSYAKSASHSQWHNGSIRNHQLKIKNRGHLKRKLRVGDQRSQRHLRLHPEYYAKCM